MVSTEGSSGGIPLITFVDFEIGALLDFLRLGNNFTVLYTVTGDRAPKAILVNSTHVQLTFQTYSYNYYEGGFLLELSWIAANGKQN